MTNERNWLLGIKSQLARVAIAAVVLLSILALVGMLFVATLLLIAASDRPSIPFTASRPVPIGSEVQEIGPETGWDEAINVALVLRGLDPSGSQLAGILTLAVPDKIVSKMNVNGDAICKKSRGGAHILRRPFRDTRLIITIDSELGLAPKHIDIPLRELLANYKDTDDYLIEIPVNIITVSNSSAYPLDYYVLDARLEADFAPSSEGIGMGAKLPVNSWLQAAAGMAGNKVKFKSNEDEAGFHVLIERDSITKFYVLILTISPLLLLFVMIRQTYQAIRTSSGPSSTIPLEAVVGVISIVPLRQVLVPNGIPGLTTIDVILGAELVLFVAVATIAAFWPAIRRSRPVDDR